MIEQLIEFSETLKCYDLNIKDFIFERKKNREGNEFLKCLEKLLPFLDDLNITYEIEYNMDVNLKLLPMCKS